MTRRVVVTGMGLVTPLGNTADSTWQALVNGQSGVDYITYFDTTNYNVKVAAQLKDFDPERYMSRQEVRRHDYYQHYIIAASQEAVACSGFEVAEAERDRSSAIVASSTGGLKSYDEYSEIIRETGNPRKMTPFAIPMLVVNAGTNVISIMTGACGPSAVPVSACATGADSIGYAFNLIRVGRIDRAIAGCGDYPIINLGIAAFDRVGACSRESENPAIAVRPFDLNRTGIVFGEGCGVLVLEELETARKRGAPIIAELVGYGSTTDGFHRTAPDPSARGAVRAMEYALEDAQMDAAEIDYINAHGTATSLNDTTETLAIKQTFGSHAYRLCVSSTKSMTGHCMGATAAMEAVFSVLALQHQTVPPTINYETPDPDCDLDYVPNEARQMRLNAVMTNAFGFGGHNASLIFKVFND